MAIDEKQYLNPLKKNRTEDRLLDRAIIFAVKAHSGSMRKGTKTPYILHPMEVAAIVAGITDQEIVIAAAVLHDVLEDTPTTQEQLRAEFGDDVLALVEAESENKREDRPATETWRLRKQETLDALRSESRFDVKAIALGDKLSNIRAMYRDHMRIGDDLWGRFNQKDPEAHAWYYRGIAAATEELQAYPAWQEYSWLVTDLFGTEV